MNKRELMMNLVNGDEMPYVPAAFFLHFDPAYHRGQAAVDKHLEFFRHTGMDLVKIQYEHHVEQPPVLRPEDWAKLPRRDESFFAEPLKVVEGLVKAAGEEALVVVTLYSPFMWASQIAGNEQVMQHIGENIAMVQQGMETITESIRAFVRGCIGLGVDGFYTSTQGGESHRLADLALFEAVVKPYDLSLMNEINRTCRFNILHVCDYAGSYDDFSRFVDYPGHVVNTPLEVGGRHLTPQEVSDMFHRPYMGGMERLGVIHSGTEHEIRLAAERVLADAPERFILAADCTVPSDTPWDNLRLAVEVAHQYRR